MCWKFKVFGDFPLSFGYILEFLNNFSLILDKIRYIWLKNLLKFLKKIQILPFIRLKLFKNSRIYPKFKEKSPTPPQNFRQIQVPSI